jgi:hypothetical protein
MGTQGQFLRAFDSDVQWLNIVAPRREMIYYTDFTFAATNLEGWVSTIVSGTSITDIPPSVGPFAGCKGLVLSGNNSRISLTRNLSCFYFGLGTFNLEFSFYVATLATSAQDYVVRVGLGDQTDSTNDNNNGVYFEYNRATSVNWLVKTATNGSRTSTTTSTAVAAGSWNRFNITVNDAANSATFFINGNLVGTITTNIPAATNRLSGPAIAAGKTAGATTGLSFYLDYWYMKYDFTSNRI